MKSNADFASGLASKTKAFIESGKVTTNDAGTILSGTSTFLGDGEGSMTVTASLMENKVTSVFSKMTKQTDDTKLAEAIADGVIAMAEASNTVSTDVSGEATNLSTGVITKVNGKGKGSFSNPNPSIESDLNDCFSEMKTYTICYEKDGSFYTNEECTEPYTVPEDAETKKTDSEKHQYIAFFGDSYFAKCLADAVETYLKGGTVSTTDSGTLAGASGTGSIA